MTRPPKKKSPASRKKAARKRARRKPSPRKRSPSNSTAGRSVRRIKQPIEIDWRPFDDGRDAVRFEDMAGELFAAEHREDAFTPNARRTGRDGGMDGVYDGKIDGVGGPWKIAIAVRQDLPAAKRKVLHENRLARKAKVRGLFFITSFNATAADERELKTLAKKGLKGARIWARPKLERVLRKHAWLRQAFFGHQLSPGFVPVAHPSELDDPSQPDLEMVGRSVERQRLRSFIKSSSRIAVLVASGGFGKTRLLRELPQLLLKLRPWRSAWVRRPGQGSIEDGFLNGMPAGKPLLIALDDAAQSPADFIELARLAADAKTADIKLIATVRAVDREAAQRALARFRATVTWIDMAELSIADGARIAKLECPRLDPSDAQRLARTFGSNLFLLRAAAQQIQRGEQPGTVVNDEDIRRLVATRLIDESQRHLATLLDEKDTLRLLSDLALNVPLAFASTTENEALAALHHSGLLRRVGDTLRFRQDVEGDLLLAYLLEQAPQRAVIEHLFASERTGDELQRVLRNLSAAGRGHAAQLIRMRVDRWLTEPAESLSRRVRLLPYCAEAAPDLVAEICVNAAHASALSANDIQSIVLSLERSDSVRGLNLIWELAALDVSHAPYAVHAIIPHLFNPLFHDPEELTQAVELLQRWIAGPLDGRRGELFASAVQALFATVASWDTSDGASFTMHEQALPAVPKLLALRRAGVELLRAMLCHADPLVRGRGVGIVHRHGAPHLGRVSTQAFAQAAKEEFLSLLPLIEARLARETDTGVLASLYSTLAVRWAAGRPAATETERLLVGRRLDPLVNAYRFCSRNDWFYDFDQVLAETPPNDRWGWWIRQYFHNRSDEERDRVVSDLCARYGTVGDLAHCLSVLGTAERPESILDGLCRRDPTAFASALELINDSRARTYAENALRRERYRVNPRLVLEELQQHAEPLADNDVNAYLSCANLRDVSVAISVARYLVESEAVAVRRRALDCIQHRDDADPAAVLDILEHALRDGDWSHHWDMILYVLTKPERQALLNQRSVLRQRIEERFLAGKEWIGDEWHEDRVLELVYGTDIERKLDVLGRLLSNGNLGSIQQVARLIEELVADNEKFSVVAEHLVRWARTLGDEGPKKVEMVIEAALGEEEPPASTFAIATSMLRSSDAVARAVGLILVAQVQRSPEACAMLAQIAANDADVLHERALSQLWSFRWPRGGWSRSIGSPPERQVALQQVLRSAEALVSGKARGLIVEVRRDVDKAIEAFAREDEETLDPR